MDVKKVYVTSGAMRWVGEATCPMDAIKKALDTHGSGGPLDSLTVFVDERGHRTDDARWKVPVEQALTEAGYIFEDEGSPQNSFDSVEE